MLQIFPEHSQLLMQVQERLAVTPEQKEYEGYDPTVGPLIEVIHGTQYDLLPGIVDFRDFLSEKGDALKVGDMVTSMIEKMKATGTRFSDDWEAVTYTMANIEKKFGRETRQLAWSAFEAKYTDR
jgi:hypothetical protein